MLTAYAVHTEAGCAKQCSTQPEHYPYPYSTSGAYGNGISQAIRQKSKHASRQAHSGSTDLTLLSPASDSKHGGEKASEDEKHGHGARNAQVESELKEKVVRVRHVGAPQQKWHIEAMQHHRELAHTDTGEGKIAQHLETALPHLKAAGQRVAIRCLQARPYCYQTPYSKSCRDSKQHYEDATKLAPPLGCSFPYQPPAKYDEQPQSTAEVGAARLGQRDH